MKCVMILGFTVLGTALSQANFLINGGFENPGSSAFNYYQDGEVPNWTVGRGDVLEVGKPSVYAISGYQGSNVMEVDSNRNVTVSQSVNLSSGTYELSFLSARRGSNLEGRVADTCDFQVIWNNSVVATLRPESTEMMRQHFSLAGVTGTNTLSFRGFGTSDTFGALIDDASIEAVPEPATCLILGLGIAALKKRRLKQRQ